MIPTEQVAGIVVTRGDVPLTETLKPLEPLADVIVWNNALDEDLAVYGRYAAIEHTEKPVILVVDDDVALTPEAVDGLLAAYEPGKIVANMPPEYRQRYTDSCLVGFGAIFQKDLPDLAFTQFALSSHANGCIAWGAEGVDRSWFDRTCDIVFTTLTPRVLVDLPFKYLPWTHAQNRMYRQPDNGHERAEMLRRVRGARNAQRVA